MGVGSNFVSNVDAPVVLRPEMAFKPFFRVAANPVDGSTRLGEKARSRREEELMIRFAPIGNILDGVELINYGFAVRVNRRVENSRELQGNHEGEEFPGLSMESEEQVNVRELNDMDGLRVP